MTGEALIIALGRTTRRIKVLDAGKIVAEIDSAQALELVSRSAFYHGCGTKRKISAIEYRRPKLVCIEKDSQWQKCWRTSEAAILPPSIEWLRGCRRTA